MIQKLEKKALEISIDKRSKYLRQLLVNCLVSANRSK